jgi:hypothetical protein
MKKVLLILVMAGVLAVPAASVFAALCSSYTTEPTCKNTAEGCFWVSAANTGIKCFGDACSTYTNPADPAKAEKNCRYANCMWDPSDSTCSGVGISGIKGVMSVINTIGNWIFAIALAIAAIFILLAAFYFITAGGNPAQASKARTMLVNCLIGVAIALAARALVAVLKSLLGAA